MSGGTEETGQLVDRMRASWINLRIRKKKYCECVHYLLYIYVKDKVCKLWIHL